MVVPELVASGRRPALCPEQRLVLCLARSVLDPAREAEARNLLGSSLSWPQFVLHAANNGLLPLAFRNLQTLGFPDTPEQVRAEMRRACQVNAVRSLLQAHELGRLLELLSSAGIPVIPWKGVALAQQLYGDVTLRVSSDIDLLVPPSSAAKVLVVLSDFGYQVVDARPVARLVREEPGCGLVRYNGSNRLVIDLHWALGEYGASKAYDRIWADARPTNVFGAPAYAMSAHWELLSLAIHACKHAWCQLKWVSDIHEECLRPELDWAQLDDTARELGVETALSLTLGVSHLLLGTPISSPCVSRRPPKWVPLSPNSRLLTWREIRMRVVLRRRLRDRLFYLSRLAFRPSASDHNALSLPERFSFLYVAIRPIRVGYRSTAHALRRAANWARGSIPPTGPHSRAGSAASAPRVEGDERAGPITVDQQGTGDLA